jgi:acyl-CoA synthetase (AMP-forming)/AMP-acid ligase II
VGGLQIFLRAIIGGGSMVLTEPGEPIADHVARLKARDVTHISGTPSHWRKLLMSGLASGFSPRYVRLSGEIADQAVLDGLSRAFPAASIGHAYASTEAGVGFAVNDGLEGFPANMVGGWRNEYGGLKGDQVKRPKELETENNRLRRAVGSDAGQILAEAEGKLLSPSRRRACVDHVTAELSVHERQACRPLAGQHARSICLA